MSPRLALTLAAAAMLAAPATANAKEITRAAACGADGCRNVTALVDERAMEGGPPSSAPARQAPFYELRYTVRGGDESFRIRTTFVPSAGRIRGDDGTWMRPPAETLPILNKLVADSRPYPATLLDIPPGPQSQPAPRKAPPAAPADPTPVGAWIAIAAAVAAALGGIVLLLRRGGGLSGGPSRAT